MMGLKQEEIQALIYAIDGWMRSGEEVTPEIERMFDFLRAHADESSNAIINSEIVTDPKSQLLLMGALRHLEDYTPAQSFKDECRQLAKKLGLESRPFKTPRDVNADPNAPDDAKVAADRELDKER